MFTLLSFTVDEVKCFCRVGDVSVMEASEEFVMLLEVMPNAYRQTKVYRIEVSCDGICLGDFVLFEI